VRPDPARPHPDELGKGAWEVRVDPDAPPGNFLPALAALLRQMARRERDAAGDGEAAEAGRNREKG
jgi:hypothetical protein